MHITATASSDGTIRIDRHEIGRVTVDLSMSEPEYVATVDSGEIGRYPTPEYAAEALAILAGRHSADDTFTLIDYDTAGSGQEALELLHAYFTETAGSSNDVVQMLDDFLVKHGFPTVLYGNA